MKSQLHQRRFVQFVFIAGVIVALEGCASMFTPIGENKYDCNRKENPDSPYCHSFRSVEKATSNDIPDSRYDQNMSIADIDQLTGIAPVNNKQPGANTSSPNSSTYESQADQKPPFSYSATWGPNDVRSKSSTSYMSCAPGYALEGLDCVQTLTGPTKNPYGCSGANGAPCSQNADKPVFESDALPPGTPVRVGPVIQRVWIKSFNDQNDMLTSDQVVYKEVVPTHWAGKPINQSTQGITSGGLPAAYPHKPPVPSSASINANPPTQTDKKDFNTGFMQPGTQVPAAETVPEPSDNGFKSMPK